MDLQIISAVAGQTDPDIFCICSLCISLKETIRYNKFWIIVRYWTDLRPVRLIFWIFKYCIIKSRISISCHHIDIIQSNCRTEINDKIISVLLCFIRPCISGTISVKKIIPFSLFQCIRKTMLQNTRIHLQIFCCHSQFFKITGHCTVCIVHNSYVSENCRCCKISLSAPLYPICGILDS